MCFLNPVPIGPMSIHPTAIIHPDAQLGSGVSVGPYALIEGPAVIGQDCIIEAHAVISGHVILGNGNQIGHGAIVGGAPQDSAFHPDTRSFVRIGNNNKIREHCTLHRGTQEGSSTVVGDDCFLMAGAHLAHNVELGNRVVLANNVLLGGHVIVADRVFVGGGCVFHQHVKVGLLAICQGASAFSKNVPPFCIGAERNGVAGLNVVGMRRAGLDSATRSEIKAAFTVLYRRGLNLQQALEAASQSAWGPEATTFFEFASQSKKRGLCDLLATRSQPRPIDSFSEGH
jgi:UDP-N-acetylglucosamine acyltransferase